jgi:hypothetical protein
MQRREQQMLTYILIGWVMVLALAIVAGFRWNKAKNK